MHKLSLVLGLSLFGAIVAVSATANPAYAQPAAVFEGTGLLEMIPASAVVGDGSTQADLYVLALDANGAPIAGLALKPAVSSGTVGAPTDAGGGLYRLAYTPPKVEARGTTTLSLKGKIGKETVQKSWSFSVAPPRSQRLSAAANPARMTLGQDRTATLSFNLAGGDRQALAGVDLIITANAGTVENVTNLGGGQFSALYTAPASNFPQVALITAADKRDPSMTYGSLAIPLWSKIDFPVTVAPGARALIKIGDQQFGPIQADAQGRARVPILVAPGAALAEKISIGTDGKSVAEPMDLKPPEGKRISFVPTAVALPGDARVQVPVHAMVVTADGRPDVSAAVVFSTTGGTIGPAKHEGNGIYTALFSPPTSAGAAQVTITSALADKPEFQNASLTLSLVSVRPAKVDLTAEPTKLPASAEGFKLFAKVTGPDGVGLGARTITMAASGARIKGDVKDLRNGDYQALFTTTGNGPVEITASVAAPITGNPLSRLLIVPSRTRTNNDGMSSTMVTIVSVDEYGYPVPNVPVAVKLTTGDGTMPQQATTNGEGLAQVFYTAGRKAGLVTFEVSAGDLLAAAALAQVPEALALPTLPIAGSKVDATLVGEWDKALSEVRVEREGSTAAVMAPAVATTSGAIRPSRAAMVSDPASISPGGTVKLRVTVSDEQGRGVAGQTLDFMASAGTVGTVTDLGGGSYEASLSVPVGTSGDVKISVATSDGTTSSFMRVPVGGADSAWSSGTPYTTTTAVDPYAAKPPPPPPPPPVVVAPPPPPPPVATTTTTTTKVKPVDGTPFLRIRAGFEGALYDYDQKPLTKATVLFPSQLILSSPAYGGHLQGRVFLPMFRYVGAEADFSAVSYSLDPKPLCEALENECSDEGLVPDTVLSTRVVAIGRYVTPGTTRFGFGGRVGWGISDVQTFSIKGGQEIQLDQLNINSLILGGELSLDASDRLFAVLSYSHHLAGGSQPWNHDIDAEVGYAFLPWLYASVAYDGAFRVIGIENNAGDAVGELTDSTNGGVLSLGFQL